MDLQKALSHFSFFFSAYSGVLCAWLLIFCRTLSFINYAPIFNRKDVAFPIKVALGVYLTSTLVWLVPQIQPPTSAAVFILEIIMNVTVGVLIGFILDLLMQAIYAAGDIINNQAGLSSAMMFDPSSRKQASMMETLMTFVTAIVFIESGCLYWLIQDLVDSFRVFPLLAIQHPLFQEIKMDYVVMITGNTIKVATELAAPVMVVTMSVDVILGIINRTAQQIPVFQLSFGIKPSIAVAVLLSTLPILISVMQNYLHDFARLF
jgi:flagellar biosynthetic protein FliR